MRSWKDRNIHGIVSPPPVEPLLFP